MIQLSVRRLRTGGIAQHRTLGLRTAVLFAACGVSLYAQSGAANPPAPGNYQPLDSTGRWRHYLDDTWRSGGYYVAAVATAIDAQLERNPPEWRRDAAGFGARTASWIGVFGIQESIHHGGAAVLGYDPRYLPCQCRGFLRRSAHAVQWSLVTKNSSGQTRPDLPAIAGAYGSGILSTSWYPARYRPLSDGVRVGNEQMIFVVGINVIKEFAPELKRALRLRH